MSTRDPMTDATQRLHRAMADLRAKAAADEPLAGTDEREDVTITVTGSRVSVHLDAGLVPRAQDRDRITTAIEQAVTNLLSAQRDRVGLDPDLSEGLVADAEAFMAEGQRHLQARLREVEDRFARFQRPTGQSRGQRP